MTNTYDAALAAVNADDQLRDRVLAASTSQEKCDVLRAAGVEPPTEEDFEAAKARDAASIDNAVGIVWCGPHSGHEHA